MRVLAANGVTAADGSPLQGTALADIGGADALAALRAGSADALLLVGGADTPAVAEALRDPAIALMSFERADAYPRRFAFLTRLVLPSGTVDFAAQIPREDVKLIATEAMLAARSDLHPALAQVLLDAARIFRWYGELVLLERAIGTHAEAPRLARWRTDLDRIERAVANIRTPPNYAGEVYQLRTHVALVRRTLDARTAAA